MTKQTLVALYIIFRFLELDVVTRKRSLRSNNDEGKQNSLFPVGSVIKCFVILPPSKIKKTAKKSFALRRLAHKFTAFSRCTT